MKLNNKHRWLLLTGIITIFYISSYIIFRYSHIEIWQQDGKAYLIFPVNYRALYYLYRPLTYLDQSITGMNFHIGPHQ